MGKLRITGGRLKGQKVFCPQGDAIRPTTGFVRESLFSILGVRLQEARVLDLFAGCGMIGFESISRGALEVVAVEKNVEHIRILNRNQTDLAISQTQYQVVKADAFSWVASKAPKPFDIIYLDPPYALSNEALQVIRLALDNDWLSENGVLIWERHTHDIPNIRFADCYDHRKYGTTTLLFIRHLPNRIESLV
jgi:16S rRNA (guanine966-N2)-methyltransferase